MARKGEAHRNSGALELSYELAEGDLAALTLHLGRQQEEFERLFHRYEYVVPGALALSALLFFVYLGKVLGGILILFFAILWYLVAPRLLKACFRRQVLAHFTEEEKRALIGPYRLRAEPEGLVVEHGGEEERFLWRDLLRVEEDDRYAFIFTDLKAGLIIPKRGLKKKQLRQFLKLVERKIAEAA